MLIKKPHFKQSILLAEITADCSKENQDGCRGLVYW